MTQKEEKEAIILVPRFKETCCTKLCKSWKLCQKDKTSDESFVSCPWFFGFYKEGWPVKHLCDYGVNAPEFPDLRTEDASDAILEYWRKGHEMMEEGVTEKKVAFKNKFKKIKRK